MANDDKTLNLFPIDYPFETLCSRMESNPVKLKLNPDFQRKYKWDQDGWQRSSKFIESCLMRIPLPSCYFAEENDGNHIVIDGVQRLTTIQKFFNDEFSLEGMTTFKELEGKKFSELGSLRSELESTTIRCIVLRKENPKALIREIFSRLNQGAVKLSDQEIRHALYPGGFDDLLNELGGIEAIKNFGLAETTTVKRDSREPDEQVLRFFAFYDDGFAEHFNNTLKDFLDDQMETFSTLEEDRLNEMREIFKSSLQKCEKIFGDDTFTNPTVRRKRKGLVHYDILMPTIGKLSDEVVNDKAENIRQAWEDLCSSNEFKRTLSGGLQNKSSVIRRRDSWTKLLKEVTDGKD
ncbi:MULTISPECIES: DUF262 domain-containing protein [Pantoea]|uniref:GmrSD restriction endonucleases N-terminal domain-containing protein n=2 Tax=Pantoea TaxID=53335 RepID=A0A0U3BQR0_9GAMM|nr:MULTISPECIES: DUF262 domain-containing protein [Pantoea]ALV90951.1 hypothetical protein LK04_01780 [Pantoea vagans]KHJ69393.1 hypothetical protein QU24_03595 [Pantoea rodasii]